MAREKIYLYPIWLRIWHWSNAIIIILLILTGISMQYSNPNAPLIPFKTAVPVHNVCGVLLSISYFVFLFGNFLSINGIHYSLRPKGFWERFTKQLRYYTYGIFKGEKAPFAITRENKFNPIQKLSYIIAMHAFIPILLITGWGLLYPETILMNFLGFSGIKLTSLAHAATGFLVSIFLIVHLYFITMGHSVTSNLQSMIDGYHEVDPNH